MKSDRDTQTAENAPTLSTVCKALDVLEYVVAANGTVGVTEVSRAVKINPSTVYRVLSTFRQYGFVEADSNSRYFAGRGLLRLVGPLLSQLEPRKAARPVMERLARESGESVNLMIPDGDQGVYVDSVQGTQSIRMVVEIGQREHYHCSAVGKAILAHMPQEAFDRLAAKGFTRFTAKTITDPSLLEVHLRLTREQGYAIDDEEGEEGTRCIGAPLFNGAGDLVGGISLAAPAFRMSMAQIEALVPKVKAAAEEISQALGYER